MSGRRVLYTRPRNEKVVHMVLYLQISQHRIALSCMRRAVEHRRVADNNKGRNMSVKRTGGENGSKVILCVPPAPFAQRFPVVLLILHALAPSTRGARHHVP